MSDQSHRSLRLHVLAAAAAIALSSSVSAVPPSAVPASADERLNLSGLQASKVHDRFIVKYRDDSPQRGDAATLQSSLRKAAARAMPAKGGRALGVQRLRRMALGAEVIRTSRKLDHVEAKALMRQIAADPNVEYVEVDTFYNVAMTPNDTRFGEQHGGEQHHNFGIGPGGTYATQAWDMTSGSGSGIVVAVIDTGITDHSDLNDNILPGYDFISHTRMTIDPDNPNTGPLISIDGDGRDDNPADPGDWYALGECGVGGFRSATSSWHGTHVTGIIAAVTNNGQGVAGMAPGVKVVPVRALGKCGGYNSDIADAITWASGGDVSGVPVNENPAEVINLSLVQNWGGPGYGFADEWAPCYSSLQSAIDGAVSRGTTVVVSAGNFDRDARLSTPGNCNNVISVAAVTVLGKRWHIGHGLGNGSNYGELVDIAAPGESILSTFNTGTAGPEAEGYGLYSGTSMAAAHVSGIVALMQSVAPTPLTPEQVESMLKSTARPFPSTPDAPIGAGIVNARVAVDAARGGSVAPTANLSFTTSGLTANFTDISTDSDGTIASRSWDFGDRSATSTAANPNKTYAAAGTYSVALTVTDNHGHTDTRKQLVTVGLVPQGYPGWFELQNGVPVGVSNQQHQIWTLAVPAGATNLRFTLTGGRGGVLDMRPAFVRVGGQDQAFDCRPPFEGYQPYYSVLTGSSETCIVPAPQAGNYNVRLTGGGHSGVSLTGSYETSRPPVN